MIIRMGRPAGRSFREECPWARSVPPASAQHCPAPSCFPARGPPWRFGPWTLHPTVAETRPPLPPQNCLSVGEQLRAVLGNATMHKRVSDLQPSSAPGACDKASCTPFPFRTGLASAHVTEEPAASPGADSAEPQHSALLEDGLAKAVSSLSPKNTSVHANGPGPELLPLLQDLCSQVSHLRAGPKAKWQEPLPRARDGLAGLT